MIIHLSASFICGVLALPAGDDGATQTDWSAGPVNSGPVTQWTSSFEAATGVAWRSIEGQLSLAATPLGVAVQETIVFDADGPRSVACGDLNGDGLTDVITTDPVYDVFGQLGAIYWWQRTEDGAWVQHFVSDDFHGAGYAAAADIDGDGDTDVYAAAYYGVIDPPPPGGGARNGRYAWFENLNGDGSEWKQHLVGELFWGAEYVDAGDIDGDGDLDLAGASWLTNFAGVQTADVVWFENPGVGSDDWTQHTLDDEFTSAYEVHIGDLDTDGDMDILASRLHQYAWWENTSGDGSTWVKRIVANTAGSPSFDIGDVDGDGDLDLFGSTLAAQVPDFATLWINVNGDGRLWQRRVVAPVDDTKSFEMYDLDGDGDLDAISSGGLSTSIGHAEWLENVDGSGSSWILRSIDFQTDRSPFITAGDIDGDGLLEAVLSTESNELLEEGELAYWSIVEAVDAGELTSAILDGGEQPEWATMSWDADIPESAALTVRVRASDDADDLGPFVMVEQAGDPLCELIDRDARYLQYQVEMATTDTDASPVLREIAVTQADLQADLDLDGVIGFGDLLILLAAWGPCSECVEDLDGSGDVGFSDLLLLLSAWGTCG